MEVRTDFSPSQVFLMVRMANLPTGRRQNLSRLARAIGVSNSNQQYREVVTHLMDLGVMTVEEEIGSSKIINLDQQALVHRVLDEQELVTFLVEQYFSEWHNFIW